MGTSENNQDLASLQSLDYLRGEYRNRTDDLLTAREKNRLL